MVKVEQWQASSIICQSGGAALADALYDYDAHLQIALRNEDAIFLQGTYPFSYDPVMQPKLYIPSATSS